MCGRIIVDYDENLDAAADLDLGLVAWMRETPAGAVSSWNLAPTEQIPVVLTSAKDGLNRYELAHWGIIPPWNTDGKPRFTFNARAEDVTDKLTFAPSVVAQRCAIPVTGFYEWSGPQNRRVPHAIFGPQRVLPLAGLYRWWKSPAGAWKLTATILTRASAGVMTPLHHRMPVFLDSGALHDWLDPELPGDQAFVDAVSEAAVPYAKLLREYPVRPLRGDGPELVERASPTHI